MPLTGAVTGWDIGGVNTKVALVDAGVVLRACTQPYELQRDPGALAPLLARLADAVGAETSDAHAVTMTAELSQCFRTKREGVHFVLDALEAAFGGTAVRVYAVDGRFLDVAAARREPIAVAASNWAATARLAARAVMHAVLVDVGTTTTDVIPIVSGQVAALGRTDPERLREGELLYLGALRTPVEAIVQRVPLDGAFAGVSAEGFALAGDVHVWRGTLDPSSYTTPTPDGRPATREFAGERLARVVCADRVLLDDRAITDIADHVAEVQIGRIRAAIARVQRRLPIIDTAVTTGLGEFLAADAARRAGLRVQPLHAAIGGAPTQCAAAAAVALLLADAGAA